MGSIRVVRLREDAAEFGLLAVDPEFGGRGVGRALIDFAERVHDVDWMELELLSRTRRTRTSSGCTSGTRGAATARRRRRDFSAVYPEPGELLAGPADLVTYRKSLRAAPAT